MGGERRRGGRGSGGRDCARGDVAGRWRADVWNIVLGGGSGGGGFGLLEGVRVVERGCRRTLETHNTSSYVEIREVAGKYIS
jgi:hypothetical protein